jgi:hypothetical protein
MPHFTRRGVVGKHWRWVRGGKRRKEEEAYG